MKYRKSLQLLSCLFAVGALVGFIITPRVFAQQSSSANYQIDEVFVGAGGGNNASSASFQARASIGDLGVGNSSSTNYQAFGGFTTTGAPYLEVNVTSTNLDLGTLSAATTTTGSTTFNVRAYLTSGYNVMIRSAPPTSEGGATITALATPTAPAVGVEQFGFNLVANTTPTTFGAVPVQIPDATFSFGAAAAGYNTANVYKYVSGETFASSNRSSGQTNYTIAYILNIAPITEAGKYDFKPNVIVTATY